MEPATEIIESIENKEVIEPEEGNTPEEEKEVIELEEIDLSKNVEVTEEDVEKKSKSQLIKTAGELRDRRNELNQEASRRATLRDRLNDETRKRVDEAHSHRERRDELNGSVQSTKDERDEMNRSASNLFKGVGGKKKEPGSK